MLYLAEVKKVKGGFMSGSETKLILLACQRNDRSWTNITEEEMISLEENLEDLGDGALVMINLGLNRQVQGQVEPAAGKIVQLLQSFSRLLEKSKSQKEEIEQWKESLTYQSEALNQREMEIESQWEQIEQMRQEFAELEVRKEDIEAYGQQAQLIQEELKNKQAALAQEQEQLEALKRQLESSSLLDDKQLNRLGSLIDSLAANLISSEKLNQHIKPLVEKIKEYKENIGTYRQKFAEYSTLLPENKDKLQKEEQAYQTLKADLALLERDLQNNQQKLAVQENLLGQKTELLGFITTQQENQNKLKEYLTGNLINDEIENKIDVSALENLPLAELEEIVANMQRDLAKIERFVNEQEEELTWKSEAVAELNEKLKNASVLDSVAIAEELAEEQECKKMLDETLIGQRRQLRERKQILALHQDIINRRQGIACPQVESRLDLEPILTSLEEQQASNQLQQERLRQEITAIKQKIAQLEQEIATQVKQQAMQVEQLQVQEQEYKNSCLHYQELETQLNTYNELIQPLENNFATISQSIEQFNSLIAQIKEGTNLQSQTLNEMQNTYQKLAKSPALTS